MVLCRRLRILPTAAHHVNPIGRNSGPPKLCRARHQLGLVADGASCAARQIRRTTRAASTWVAVGRVRRSVRTADFLS
jgi:hypothetical protein